jgi:hypothetical protein
MYVTFPFGIVRLLCSTRSVVVGTLISSRVCEENGHLHCCTVWGTPASIGIRGMTRLERCTSSPLNSMPVHFKFEPSRQLLTSYITESYMTPCTGTKVVIMVQTCFFAPMTGRRRPRLAPNCSIDIDEEMPYGNYLSSRLCLLVDLTPSTRPSLCLAFLSIPPSLLLLLSLCLQAIK